jgi:hypothetical protein
MKRKSWTARVLFLLVTAVVSVTTFSAAAEPGSSDDPLVTLSYLNDTYLSAVLTKVDAKIAQRNAALSGQLGQQTGTAASGSGTSAVFSVVTLSSGQTLTGEIGCEVMLRVGTATCVAPSTPGLVDETAGSTLAGGKALTQNHLYMMTVEGRGVKATAATTKLLVRGGYTVQ